MILLLQPKDELQLHDIFITAKIWITAVWYYYYSQNINYSCMILLLHNSNYSCMILLQPKDQLQLYDTIIITIIIIEKGRPCNARRDSREWNTPYQSEYPSPTIPTCRQKEEKWKKSKSKWKSDDLLRTEIYIEHKIFYQLKHDQDWSVNLASGCRQGRLLLYLLT